MYLAGVSARRVDDTGQLPWGDRMPSQTLSDKLKRVYAEIDEWRNRPLGSEYPYVFMTACGANAHGAARSRTSAYRSPSESTGTAIAR